MAVRPDMVGLVVKDMRASLAFYRALGLSIPEGVDEEPFVEITTENGYRISWNSLEMVRGIDPGYADPRGYRMSIAYLCDSPAEVDSVYAGLTSLGYRSHLAPWDAFWGQRYAVVLDPDDNPVDLLRRWRGRKNRRNLPKIVLCGRLCRTLLPDSESRLDSSERYGLY
jgi:catechol 2,3-dioxygenase-like lactoylglutathione lyase family enzyme